MHKVQEPKRQPPPMYYHVCTKGEIKSAVWPGQENTQVNTNQCTVALCKLGCNVLACKVKKLTQARTTPQLELECWPARSTEVTATAAAAQPLEARAHPKSLPT